MIIPIRTDRRLNHTPVVNVGLIVANVFVFALTSRGGRVLDHPEIHAYFLNPALPRLVQYISYQFLHADWMHLAGNMLFLWVFGNSVEDRLGKVGYLGFYLAGGVLAALGHVLLKPDPVLGASGSVAAVTGAYLALFPLSKVTIVYWILFIGMFEISSMLLILFQIGYNTVFYLLDLVADVGRVAYLAHLCGYAYGFVIGLGLLKLRLLKREPFDLLALLEQYHRRAQFRAMTRKGYQPWAGSAPSPEATGAPSADQEKFTRLREQVTEALNQRRIDDAVAGYVQLLQHDEGAVLSESRQLDLANHLMVRQRYDLAAGAYEAFLKTYRQYHQPEQVQLILALIYVRYLNRAERARELLHSARPRLGDAGQKKLAEQMISELA